MKNAEATMPAGEKARGTARRTKDRTVRVLLAEDDDSMRALLAEALEGKGYEVTQCGDGLSLVGRIGDILAPEHGNSYDILVSDIRLPGFTGLEILSGLAEEPLTPPVVLITAFGDEETHAEAERLGAAALLDKPFEIERLLDIVAELVGDE
jgi:DNA-binding response OmpR family regulator